MKILHYVLCVACMLLFSCGESAEGPNVFETTNGYVSLTITDSSGKLQPFARVIAVPSSYNVLTESDTVQVFGTLKNGLCTLSLHTNLYYNIFVLDTLGEQNLFIDSIKISNTTLSIVDSLRNSSSLKVENEEILTGAKVAIIGSPFKGESVTNGVIEVPTVPSGMYPSVVYYANNEGAKETIGQYIRFFPDEVTKIKELSTEVKFMDASGDSRFNYATASLIASDGTIWIGTTNGGVFAFDGYRWEHYESSIFNSRVNALAEDENGQILAGNEEALYQFDGNTFNLLSVDGKSAHTPYLDMAVVESYAYFLGADFLVSADNNSLTATEMPFYDGCVLEVITKDSLWVGTKSNGLFLITEKDTVHYTQSNTGHKLPSNEISFVESDGDKGIWIGTKNGLVYHDMVGNWKTYNAANVISMKSNSITAGYYVDGTIWISTGDLTLQGFDGANWRSYSNLSLFGHASAPILSITSEKDGALWLASNGFGVVRFIAE